MNPIQAQLYRELPGVFYEESLPAEPASPTLIELNRGFLQAEGVASDWFETPEALGFLAGNGPYETSPLAMAYSGHQFAHWVPILGDGRAHMLGQMLDGQGASLDVQLKGSGRTQFSRGGDGKATLGSVMREYLISEAMQGLGIPTTCSLAVIGTGEKVMREAALPGAVLVRTARSHIRVGSFQYAAASQGAEGVKALVDFMITHHFPALVDAEDQYADFLKAVIERQASLIAQWMLVGFIHGVMNTDNMSIVGETIDFGPCAFMDEFHPNKVFSSIDRHGRYAWDQQPNIGLWNLTQLAGTLLPLLDEDVDKAESVARAQLDAFGPAFRQAFNTGLFKKLGLNEDVAEEKAAAFIETTFATLTENAIDFTLFFDRLTQFAAGAESYKLIELFASADKGQAWLSDWSAIRSDASDVVQAMRQANPAIIARNHRVEQAIEEATLNDDFTLFRRLSKALANPYVLDEGDADLQLPPTQEERVTETFCGT